jgi:hypothetical protein
MSETVATIERRKTAKFSSLPPADVQLAISSWVNDQFETASPTQLPNAPKRARRYPHWTSDPNSGITGDVYLVRELVYYTCEVADGKPWLWWRIGRLPDQLQDRVDVSRKSVKVPSEIGEAHATDSALKQIYDYISPGTNEGISFEVARLTDDLFTTSFTGGGDISLFTASGSRGTIKSQLTEGYVLSSTGAPPITIPFDLAIDLASGVATLSWTLPAAVAATAQIKLDFTRAATNPEGINLLFTTDDPSDDAVYSLSLLLI